jgi:hypothetical protein
MGLLDRILGRTKKADDGESKGGGGGVASVLEPSPDQLGGVDSAAAKPGVSAGEGGNPEAPPGS